MLQLLLHLYPVSFLRIWETEVQIDGSTVQNHKTP